MRRLPTILILLFTLGVGGVTLGSQTSEPVTAQDLLFEITPSKSTYVLYEPVIVTYIVRNPTAENIHACIEMNIQGDVVKFWIENDKGEKVPYKVGGGIFYGPGDCNIAPGGLLISDIGFEARERVLQEPGSYKIHAQAFVLGTGVVLEAEPKEVQIAAPERKDVNAIEFFESEEEFLQLMKEGPNRFCKDKSESDGYGRLETFLDHHSDSAYTPTIMISLAYALKAGKIDVNSSLELAIEHYRAFLDKWPSHPFAWKAMYGLAQALRDAGALQEATEMVSRFESSFPDRQDHIDELRWNVLLERELSE